MIFTGDLFFADGSTGGTDHSYSSSQDLKKSISKILSLPENTLVYPGHGESTTIRELTGLFTVH